MKRRLSIAILLTLLVAGAAWLSVRAIRNSAASVVLLPNGTLVRVRGVTYGTNHVASEMFALRRLLPPMFRSLIKRWFGLPTGSGSRVTEEPCLVLWLVSQSQTSNALAGVFTNYEIHPLDPEGNPVGSKAHLGSPAGSSFLNGYQFAAFPRRSASVQFAILQRNPSGTFDQLGRLACPNPIRTNPPPWTAGELPLQAESGLLAATLTRLLWGSGAGLSTSSRAGGSTVTDPMPAKANEPPHAFLEVSFTDHGRPGTNWTIGRLEVADATGNLLPASGSSLSRREDVNYFNWDPVLTPSEVWELQLTAKRLPEAEFSPAELVEFNDLDVPARDRPVKFDRQVVREGVTVKLTSLRLRPPVDRSQGSVSSEEYSEVKLTASGLKPGWFLDLVQLKDDSGSRHRPVSWGRSSDGEVELTYGLETIPAETRKVDLSFALHRGETFKFRVQPTRWQGVRSGAGE